MTKAEVCSLIDGLWVSKAHRHQLKYKIQTRMYAPEELNQWGTRFTKAVDLQHDMVKRHAPSAAQAPDVADLSQEYSGSELNKRRRMLAGKLLRQAIRKEAGLSVPADLSRQAVEKYL